MENHEHNHEHEYEHEHEHEHEHHHGHHHDPAEKKRQLNRLARIMGQMRHIKKMIESDEDCSAILIQIASTRSALGGLGKEIINEHITHCVTHAIEDGDTAAVEEFQKAIQKYL